MYFSLVGNIMLEKKRIKIKIHNFEDRTIYYGEEFGRNVRFLENFDKKDKDDNLYEIELDPNTTSLNSSFMIGAFAKSVKKLGMVKFNLKYEFNFDNFNSELRREIIEQDLADAIHRFHRWYEIYEI